MKNLFYKDRMAWETSVLMDMDEFHMQESKQSKCPYFHQLGTF